MDPRLAGIKGRLQYLSEEDLRGLPTIPTLSQPFFEDPKLAQYMGLPSFPGARAHYVAAELQKAEMTIAMVYRSLEVDEAAFKKPPR